MAEGNISKRLRGVAAEFNVSIARIIEFLAKKGFAIDSNPNTKILPEMYNILAKEFQTDKSAKEAATKINIDISKRESISIDEKKSKETLKTESDNIPSKSDIFIKNDKTLAQELKSTEKTESKSQKTIKEKDKTPKLKEEKTKSQPVEADNKESIKDKDLETIEENKPSIESSDNTAEKLKEKVIEDIEKPAKSKANAAITLKGKINLDEINQKTKPDKKTKKTKTKDTDEIVIDEKPKKEKSKKPIKEIPDNNIPETVSEENIEIKIESDEPAVIEEIKPIETPQEDITVPSEANIDSDEITLTTETPDVSIPENFIKTEYLKIDGPVILGKINLPVEKEIQKKDKDKKKDKTPPPKPAEISPADKDSKKKRKRIERKEKMFNTELPDNKSDNLRFKDRNFRKPAEHVEIKEEDIEKQIKETLARLTGTGKTKSSKYRRQKRELFKEQREEEIQRVEEGKKMLQVAEFVTANELASMMNVSVNDIISMCLNLGIFVSINQRLDAETLSIVAEEFGYKVEFVTLDAIEKIKVEEDKPEDLIGRPPIVTVMGHVDHGKTSLLDYIRKTNVIAGEAGGITQHIGAYEVLLENGKMITFLDTPGHEAFTAMRARGTKVTDVAIIVVAADEDIMPQTKEAINHASAAGVPIVFAINKIDKPNANIDRIKEGLAKLNYLVEDWGGKYQCQEISAKKGLNIDLLLDKVLLEAELLELKANPKKNAYGTVIESSLDKGKGYVAKLLVQDGTLKIGDIIIAGHCFGKVKAMYNERNINIKKAGPASPLLLLGLNGAPQAGDTFNVFDTEQEAKEIATKRLQLQREQSLRTQKHITLDEIGRRIAIGDFKQLNIIVKGDVDGSVEALADSLLKLSSEQVQVNVIHKSVGQITESDVLLASASDAVIIGFQVRPSHAARKLAQQEQIDIRLYSIIYNAINELKSAIEGMLSPEIVEKTTSNIEVREVFRITKVGSVAGCLVLDGKLTNKTKVHLIRDGIVVYTGELSSLKHYKDDVKDVKAGMECGLSIKNFNDIKVGDIIEGFEEIEVQRKL